MTTSMIFWSIVFLLALIGLVWLFARDAKPTKRAGSNPPATSARPIPPPNPPSLSLGYLTPPERNPSPDRFGEFNERLAAAEDYIANPAEMRNRDQLPPKVLGPERNPAEVMRKDLVDCGLPVDHESFDRAAEWLASPAPRKPDYRYRSAITGKFVKASYAKRYPHRTVRSKVKS